METVEERPRALPRSAKRCELILKVSLRMQISTVKSLVQEDKAKHDSPALQVISRLSHGLQRKRPAGCITVQFRGCTPSAYKTLSRKNEK